MTSEQGEMSLRSMQSVCTHPKFLFAVNRGRLQGVRKSDLQSTAGQTCLGNVIFDSIWFQVAIGRLKNLRDFQKQYEMIGGCSAQKGM